MTQSVAQKKLIPEKTWRRQSDSPSWWIAFCCGSVILHLFVFWFISLYELNSSRQGNGSFATIDFIEISSQKSSRAQTQTKPKTKPKSVSTKPASVKPIVPQNSQSVVKTPVYKIDRNAIAFNNQKIEQQLAEQQRQQLLEQQKLADQKRQLEAQQLQIELEQQRQLEAQQRQLAEKLRLRQAQQLQLAEKLRQREVEQQRQLAEKLRQQEAEQERQLEAQRQQEAEQERQLEAQRQQEAEQKRQLEAQRQQEAEQERQLEAQRQREQREQQQKLLQKLRQRRSEQLSQNPGDGEKITDAIANQQGLVTKQPKLNSQTPQSPVKINQNEKIPLNQSGETQLNQSGGILTGSWNIDTTTPITKDIPANPPKLKENISKSFVIPASEANNFQSANFKVYLLINEEGIVELAEVDRNIPVDKRLQYREYVEKHFLNKKLFEPATDPDPRTGELKPRRGELFIRIKIQQGY